MQVPSGHLSSQGPRRPNSQRPKQAPIHSRFIFVHNPATPPSSSRSQIQIQIDTGSQPASQARIRSPPKLRRLSPKRYLLCVLSVHRSKEGGGVDVFILFQCSGGMCGGETTGAGEGVVFINVVEARAFSRGGPSSPLSAWA